MVTIDVRFAYSKDMPTGLNITVFMKINEHGRQLLGSGEINAQNFDARGTDYGMKNPLLLTVA
jgi:hypothetical protein